MLPEPRHLLGQRILTHHFEKLRQSVREFRQYIFE
jgi:hypothetical protein